MRKYFAGFLGALALSASAHATTITYEYTAAVSAIYEYDYRYFPVPLRPNTLAVSDGTIAVGGTVRGQFTYDTSTVLQQDPYFTTAHTGVAPTSTATAIFDGSTVSFQLAPGDSRSNISINDNNPYTHDGFFVSVYAANGRSIQLNFTSNSDTALSGPTIPAFLSGFDKQYIYLGGADALSGNTYTAFAAITSLQQLGAVPEPATYAMMMSGLGLLGWAARRKKPRA